MFAPQIEYIDERDIVLPPPVRKQIWNGTEFVLFKLYRRHDVPSVQESEWLWKTYGGPGVWEYGRCWNFSNSGNFTVMDDKVYIFFTMKWGA